MTQSGHSIREFSRADARPRRAGGSASTSFHPARPAAWERNAVDITRLDKTDPAQRRQINTAWRALKTDSADDGQRLAKTFADLRRHFPDAGIEVPAETLNEGKDDG